MVATMAAGYLIIMQLILDDKHDTKIMVPHKDWDVNQFFLSFGTILFALSSATSFPTIQNNIFKHNEWSHSVVACFTSEYAYYGISWYTRLLICNFFQLLLIFINLMAEIPQK